MEEEMDTGQTGGMVGELIMAVGGTMRIEKGDTQNMGTEKEKREDIEGVKENITNEWRIEGGSTTTKARDIEAIEFRKKKEGIEIDTTVIVSMIALTVTRNSTDSIKIVIITSIPVMIVTWMTHCPPEQDKMKREIDKEIKIWEQEI